MQSSVARVRGSQLPIGLDESSSSYSVLYCEHFNPVEIESRPARVSICVKWWPPQDSLPERFDVEVRCQLLSQGAYAASGPHWRPVLLWDVWDSELLDWSPPSVLPACSSLLEVDTEHRCIVTHLCAVKPSLWLVKLTWQCNNHLGRLDVPDQLQAQLQAHKCRRSQHQCFNIPLRCELENQRCLSNAGRLSWQLSAAEEMVDLKETREEIERLRGQREELERQIAAFDLHHQDQECKLMLLPPVEVATDLERKIKEEVLHRRICQEELMNLRGRIRIFCRIRGHRPDEVAVSGSEAVIRDSRTEVSLPSLQRNFEFDLVFGPETPTSDIWEEVWPLVDSVFDKPGTHACVMAYGQTGSGKTFTMEGLPEQPGLIVKTVEHLFSRIADAIGPLEMNAQYPPVSISVSMVEIYEKQIYDLLNLGTADAGSRLGLMMISENGFEVKGMRVANPHSCEEAVTLYQCGMKLRKLGTSERNARSSRSHIVFGINIHRCDPETGEILSTSKISHVDLAGSERQSSSSAFDRTRVKEASSINQSLTTLGKVVQACISRSSNRQSGHVPYRDSALTQLLSDSIGGQAKTLIIVHVTPNSEDAQESCCTLQFAANAACVQERTTTKTEDERRNLQLARITNENNRLRAELQHLGRACSASGHTPMEVKESNGSPKLNKSSDSHNAPKNKPSFSSMKENCPLANRYGSAHFMPVMLAGASRSAAR